MAKDRGGAVESLRVLRTTRKTAVKCRRAALQQLHNTIVAAPDEVRDRIRSLTRMRRLRTCAAWRPDAAGYRDPAVATKLSLKSLARRILDLDDEIAELDRFIAPLVEELAPDLLKLEGVGTASAGELLVAAGENLGRLRSEASFAMLCGASPLPASSGKTQRHRLNRGGNRQANSALHMIVVCRMRNRPANPSLCPAAYPGGAVQARGDALPEALRGPRDPPRPHRPITCLTNMRASKAPSSPARRSPTGCWPRAWRSRWMAGAASSTTSSSSGCWRSLKYEAVYLHELRDGLDAERIIGSWIDFYNEVRPHSSLGRRTPGEAYRNGEGAV